MRLGVPWLLAAVCACGSETHEPSDGRSGASGSESSGGDGPSHGPAGAGGDGSATGGVGPHCPTTFDGTDESVFDQPTSRVRVLAFSDAAVVDGAVLDGTRREIHTEAARSGLCRLLRYDSPSFCEPACENPELCVAGTCERFPVPISAGTLRVELGEARSVVVEPDELGRYYSVTEGVGYEAMERVKISAEGDVARAFELEACLSPAPEPTSEWEQRLRTRSPGEDVELAWSNSVSTARVYLRMTTCTGTHGGISPVEVECEGPDVGTLTLPGAFLDALYENDWGHGECGLNELVRYHESHVGAADDRVQLRAEATAQFFFHPGLAD